WFIEDKKIDPKCLLDFLELYWPSFIKKGEFIFLKDKFSESEYKRLINEKVNPEYWIDLLTVNDFFPEITNGEQYSIKLAKALTEIWKVKLKHDFPSMNFVVEYLHDKECGDYGLTFYQSRN